MTAAHGRLAKRALPLGGGYNVMMDANAPLLSAMSKENAGRNAGTAWANDGWGGRVL